MGVSAIGILLLHAAVRPAHVCLSVCSAAGQLTCLLLPGMLCNLPDKRMHRVLHGHWKHRFKRELHTPAHFIHGAYHQPFYCHHLPVRRNGTVQALLPAAHPSGLHLHFKYPLPSAGIPPAPAPLILPYYKTTLVKCVGNANGDATHVRHYPTDSWLPLLPHRGILKSTGCSVCGTNYEIRVWAWVPEVVV